MSSSPEKNAELMTTTKEIRIVAVKWSGGPTFTSRAGSLLVRPVGSYFDSSRTPSTDDDDHGLLCRKEKSSRRKTFSSFFHVPGRMRHRS